MSKKQQKGGVAWNETVREMAKKVGAVDKKRETRKRRAATRNKFVAATTSDVDLAELRLAARLDLWEDLEVDFVPEAEDDDFFDEDAEEKPAKRVKVKRRNADEKKKLRRPRSLAQVLLEEYSGTAPERPDYLTATAGTSRRSLRHKICYVTGRRALYRDPQTDLDYADSEALQVLREHSPAFVKLTAPSSPYFETTTQLLADRRKQQLKDEGTPKMTLAPCSLTRQASAAAAALRQ